MAAITAGLFLSMPCRANDLQSVEGPNVRKMRHEDGSQSIYLRTPDNKTLTKKTYSANGHLTMLTTYKMDNAGNPLGCKIKDGRGEELYKVSYGYHKITGLLVSERMFDSRVKRTRDGIEIPVQEVKYVYDAEGNRSAPMVFNYLPGKTFEQVFGVKSSALDVNPFKNGEQ